jgi:Na+-translocating ferredoxin:NAD+ oxidoreductase RnfA subunit
MPKSFGAACSGLLAPRDTHNLRVFSAWVVAAALSFATSLIVIDGMPSARGPLGWFLATLTGVLAVAAIRAYLRFIRVADELLRKIQLDGLAVGFGAGVVFTMCSSILERLGAPRLEMSAPFVVMLVFWALGQYLGMRRYMADDEP